MSDQHPGLRRVRRLEPPRLVATLLLTLALAVSACARQNNAEEASSQDDVALYFDKTAPGQGIIFLLVSFQHNQVDAVQGSPSNDGSIVAERHTALAPNDRGEIEALFVRDRLDAYRNDNTAGSQPGVDTARASQDGGCPDGSACTQGEPCLCLPPPGSGPQGVRYVVDYKPERLYYVFDDANGDLTSDLVRRLEDMHGRYLRP